MTERYSCLFPELAHFPSRRERLRALNAAFSAIPCFLALVLLILAATAAMTYTLDVLVLRPIFRLHSTAEWVALAGLLFFGTVLTSLALVGGAVQRHLRLQLKATGVDLCAECGYRLKGLDSLNCPECGNDRSHAAGVRHPLAVRLLLWAGLLFAAGQLLVVFPLSLFAGRLAWSHAPALLCWACLGAYCWAHTISCLSRRRPLRFR